MIDEHRAGLAQAYSQEEVEELSNYEWATFNVHDLYVTAEEQYALDTFPEKW